MVGHSGKLEPAIAAVETLDDCLARLEQAIEAVGGQMLVTADHGNVEQMRDPSRTIKSTRHTPVILYPWSMWETNILNCGLRVACVM